MSDISMIIIDICILIFSSIGVLISTAILFLIFYHRQQSPIDTAILLLCNTYIAITYTCLNFIIMYGYILYGDLYGNVSFNSWWCYGHAYVLLVGLCSIYYSYFLQSCFRFFRVILYKYKRLQRFWFTFKLIVVQWLISFLVITFALFLRYFEYLPKYYHCQVLFTNFGGLSMTLAIVYFGPTIASGILYVYIIHHTKHQTNVATEQIRYRSIQRDLVVLRRIVVLITAVLILSMPTLILWIYYLITGYLHPLSYHLEWLLFSVSLATLSAASAILTPQIRRLIFNQWRHTTRVQPINLNNAFEHN